MYRLLTSLALIRLSASTGEAPASPIHGAAEPVTPVTPPAHAAPMNPPVLHQQGTAPRTPIFIPIGGHEQIAPNAPSKRRRLTDLNDTR